jgi:hypothetical protein
VTEQGYVFKTIPEMLFEENVAEGNQGDEAL